MGKPNTAIRRYLSDKERYADLFNAACCSGEQVFRAEDLENADGEQDAVLETAEGSRVIVQRFRDLKMTAPQDTKLIILAEETQHDIHYAMPVRSMLYDALDYAEQVKQIGEKNKKEKNYKNSAEFLSGLTKEDRLAPALTLCLYIGDGKWDGCTDLHSLLGIDDKMPDAFKKYIPNYHTNLVDAKELANSNLLKTDLQYLFGMLEYRQDKEKLTSYMHQHRDYFENVDLDSYYAAEALLGNDRKLKEFRQKEGTVNMCKALEDLYQDGRAEGRAEGRTDKIKEQIQKKLAKGHSAELIADALEEDIEVIKKLIEEVSNQ